MDSVKPSWARAALVPSLFVVALGLTAQAHATCVDSKSLHPSVPPKATDTGLMPAVYHPGGAGGSFVRVWDEPRSIVGLWEFKWAGFATDWGLQAWHSDGTELTFSTGQNPETGDTCQGVWQQVGPRTYTLNHIAMGWVAPGASPTAGSPFLRVHLHFTVTLDPSGNSFSGKYTASVYLETESDPFDEDPVKNPAVASGSGTVTATRVSPDP